MGDAKGRESIEESGVRNGIKGRTKIKKDEDGDESRVSSYE